MANGDSFKSQKKEEKRNCCVDCGKIIKYKAKRCERCRIKFMIGEKSPHWKGGKERFRCMDCNKIITYSSKRCSFCSSKFRSKENNPAWQGGVSRRPYSFDFDNELKELIRKRDNYKCQNCGCPQEECYRKLDVHHIDYDKQSSEPKNLIALCHTCNSKVNANRRYWTNYFQNRQEIINVRRRIFS